MNCYVIIYMEGCHCALIKGVNVLLGKVHVLFYMPISLSDYLPNDCSLDFDVNVIASFCNGP